MKTVLVVIALCLSVVGQATYSGSGSSSGAAVYSSTTSTASCSQADVQTAINSASDGDTVTIPAASCTWATPVAFCKSVTLQGAGVGSTVITVNTGTGWEKDGIVVDSCSGKQIRITGITFHNQSSDAFGMLMFTGGTGLSLRLDHNTFDAAGTYGRAFSFRVPCVSPGCVADHNTITDQGFIIENLYPGDTNGGDHAWAVTTPFETINAFYLENNTITYPSYATHPVDIDCDDGGSYVFRYNSESGNAVGNHGYDSVANGCMLQDVYQNTLTANSVAPFAVQYRGGMGVVYDNVITGSATDLQFGITDYRSTSAYTAGIHDHCDGTGTEDQNSSPSGTYHGWHCYEQVGMGAPASAFTSYPLYEWDNCTATLGCTAGSGSQITATVYQNYGGGTDYTSQHIVQNRDYYDQVASFSGATGIGRGTLASRPLSCTAGVAYWETDHNVLDECASTNTWAAYYTPYTYPHPLTGGTTIPSVSTTTASSITSTTASAGGTVASNGGASVTAEGTCYATTANPTSPCTSDGTATPFTSSLTGLSSSTLYHYRAFATNSVGTAYGSDLTFTTSGSSGTTHNVTSSPCNATGNGSTDDTAAINTCIAALSSGDTLYFPAPSVAYKAASQLSTITVPVEIKGDSQASTTIHSTAGSTYIWQLGNGGLTSTTPLLADAAELATSFTASVSALGGVSIGDYVLLQEGGIDYSTDSGAGHPLNCDVSGCRGEVVKVCNVSSNTITVCTALHFPYNVATNGANVAKITSPLAGLNLHGLTFTGTATNGLLLQGLVASTVNNVTFNTFANSALYVDPGYGDTFSNITVTASGSSGASAVDIKQAGNMLVSNLSITAPARNAFGFFIGTSANNRISGLALDWTSSTAGRPLKFVATSHSIFDGVSVSNAAAGYNGLSFEYYSGHNILSNSTLVNNNTSNADTFGNYNDFLVFLNDTMTVGTNGAVTSVNPGVSALGRRDTNLTISGGTYAGSDSNSEVQINGNNAYLHDATFGPGSSGQGGANISSNPTTGNCVNNNTFIATLNYAYAGTGSTGYANSNTLNGNSTPGAFPTGACATTTSVSSLTFGSQAVGTSSSSQAVTLTNPTASSVVISMIDALGDFSQTNNCGTLSSGGGNCTINVNFMPTATGTRTGVLAIYPTTVGGTAVVSLSGVGGDGSP